MVDPSACANAEPLSRLEQLERENADFRTWGIIEVAIRNPNVAEYMAHWEARTQKAEAENEALRTKLETVEAETRERCAKVGALVSALEFASERYADERHGGLDTKAMNQAIVARNEARKALISAIRNLVPRHD